MAPDADLRGGAPPTAFLAAARFAGAFAAGLAGDFRAAFAGVFFAGALAAGDVRAALAGVFFADALAAGLVLAGAFLACVFVAGTFLAGAFFVAAALSAGRGAEARLAGGPMNVTVSSAEALDAVRPFAAAARYVLEPMPLEPADRQPIRGAVTGTGVDAVETSLLFDGRDDTGVSLEYPYAAILALTLPAPTLVTEAKLVLSASTDTPALATSPYATAGTGSGERSPVSNFLAVSKSFVRVPVRCDEGKFSAAWRQHQTIPPTVGLQTLRDTRA